MALVTKQSLVEKPKPKPAYLAPKPGIPYTPSMGRLDELAPAPMQIPSTIQLAGAKPKAEARPASPAAKGDDVVPPILKRKGDAAAVGRPTLGGSGPPALAAAAGRQRTPLEQADVVYYGAAGLAGFVLGAAAARLLMRAQR
jgi:hypothetical protein